MNIFYLDHNPVIAAQYLVDSHVANGKMIVEAGQMLANCYSLKRLSEIDVPLTQKGKKRVHGYYNHCCSKWVRSSLSNFQWLVDHAIAMGEERYYRTGKGHFTSSFINWCNNNKPDMVDLGLTTPAMAFNNCDQFKDVNDVVSSYRKFYVFDKRFNKKGYKMDVYTKRNKPQFWQDYNYIISKYAA